MLVGQLLFLEHFVISLYCQTAQRCPICLYHLHRDSSSTHQFPHTSQQEATRHQIKSLMIQTCESKYLISTFCTKVSSYLVVPKCYPEVDKQYKMSTNSSLKFQWEMFYDHNSCFTYAKVLSQLDAQVNSKFTRNSGKKFKFLIHILKLSVLKLKEESRIFTAKNFPQLSNVFKRCQFGSIKEFFFVFSIKSKKKLVIITHSILK